MGLPVPVNSALTRDNVQLGRDITVLCAQINIANFRLLKMIAEFDARGGWRCGGTVRSCAHWLASHCGMAIGAAREKVRVARRLAGLPEVEQAFSTGGLSYSKVRAITRVATQSNEGMLVKLAEQASASHLEQLVAKYPPVDEFGLEGLAAAGAVGAMVDTVADGLERGAADTVAGSVAGSVDDNAEDGADDGVADSAVGAVTNCAADSVESVESGADDTAANAEARREQARELYWFQDKDGMWIIHARLPPEQGQLVIKTLEAVARPLLEERQDAWKHTQKARLQAVAQHMARRHREAGVNAAGRAEPGDAEPGPAQQRAAGTNSGVAAGGNVGSAEAGSTKYPAAETAGGVAAVGNVGSAEAGSTKYPAAETAGGVAAVGNVGSGEAGSAKSPAAETAGGVATGGNVGSGEAGSTKSPAAETVGGTAARGDVVLGSIGSGDGSSGEAGTSNELDAGTIASLELERAQEKISAETFSQFMNQVRADAFASMAEHFLATSGDYPQFQGLKGSERCQVVLHVDINTLREQRAGVCCVHNKAHFEDKPWLSPQTARRLSCDASLVTVLEDEQGKVLNVGRRSRIVPPPIRRALIERDGVCRYPGCHESRYVDAHHVRHWADGGETSLRNLVTLCKFHHRQLHRGCFEVHVENASSEISGSEPQLVFTARGGG